MRRRTDTWRAYACHIAAWASLLGGASSMLVLPGCASFFGPHEKRADTQLLPTVGNTARGSVTFIERADGVQVTYNLLGLPPNSDHALQVHERGDCNASDASSAGLVFTPASERLKPGVQAEGDLGNIHADANGVAIGFIVAPEVSLDGVRSVLGRAVLIHRDSSDAYALTDHDAGPALACGLIKPQ